jgi:hypothetical protein
VAASVRSFAGWTIAEAVEHCVEPDVHARLTEAQKAWGAVGSPTRFVFRSVYVHGEYAERANARTRRDRGLYQAVLAADANLLKALWSELARGSLLGWGRRASPMAEPGPIPSSAWSSLKVKSRSRSKVTERTNDEVIIFDVRIYPVLEAPNAISQLAGLTFLEACQAFVFADPEVAAARKRVVEAGGALAPLGFPRAPYRAVWPVTLGHGSDDDPVGCLQDDGSESNRYSREADALLYGRFARLIRYLADGELQAEGIDGSSRVAPVPRALWQRATTFIDLENGDLLERSRHARDAAEALSAPWLRGLLLSRSQPNVEPAGPTQNEPKRSVLRLQTSARAERACCEWLSSEMKNSPDIRLKSKDAWWEATHERWPDRLSRRAFDRAWDAAISASGAHAWSLPGAPRKSARS